MTERGHTGPEEPRRDPVEAATDELAQVRELLVAAQRGDADAVEVAASLKGYLDRHGPALQEAAKSVGEEARKQALSELYKWRGQLDAQLKARQEGTPPG